MQEFGIFVFAIATTIATATHESGTCPDEWTYLLGRCYKAHPEKVTWKMADSTCQQEGGYLGMDENIQTAHSLSTLMEMNDWRNMWLAARERSHPWTWIRDGSMISNQGCYWVNTENGMEEFQSETFTPETCNSQCRNNDYLYACVTVTDDLSEVICKCGKIHNAIGLSEIIHNTDELTTGCNQECPSDPGQKCGKPGAMICYDLRADNMDNLWYENQPNNLGGYQTCIALLGHHGYKWGDVECSTRAGGFICQYDIPAEDCSTASRTWFEGAQRCVSFNSGGFNSGLTWVEAQERCGDDDESLATVDTMQFINEMSDELRATNDWWIGGHSSTWYDVNDESNALFYTKWANGEPTGVGKECVVKDSVVSQNKPYKWVNKDCDETYPFVCLRATIPTHLSTSTTSTVSSSSSTTPSPTVTQPPAPTRGCNEFVCSSGECLFYDWQCDGIVDCVDGSDEMECDRPVCQGYQCDSGRCANPRYVCDGTRDCNDNSDEIYCGEEKTSSTTSTSTTPATTTTITRTPSPTTTTRTTTTSSPTTPTTLKTPASSCNGFECSSGDKCSAHSWQCDRMLDCDDSSDELACLEGVCVGFQCVSGRCTSPDWACDGLQDCDDNTDEELCYEDLIVSARKELLLDGISTENMIGNAPVKRDNSVTYSSFSTYIYDKPLTAGVFTHFMFYTTGKPRGDAISVATVRLQIWQRVAETLFELAWDRFVRAVLTRDGKVVTVALEDQITLQENSYLGWTFKDRVGFISYELTDRVDESSIAVLKRDIPGDDPLFGEKYLFGPDNVYYEMYSIAIHIIPDCTGFKCGSGECIYASSVCNREVECEDRSDEFYCSYCVEPDDYLCSKTGHCIPGFQRCDSDRVKNCPMGEDELYCDCGFDGVLCNNTGVCIHETSMCDRDEDCEDGEDESRCESCWEHACYDYKGCYDASELCDGTYGCEDRSDEKFCVRLAEGEDLEPNLALARKSGPSWAPICYDSRLGDFDNILVQLDVLITEVLATTCNALGYQSDDASVSPFPIEDLPSFANYLQVNVARFYEESLTLPEGKSPLFFVDSVDRCPSGHVVKVECLGDRAGCGRRKDPKPLSQLYAVNGRWAESGAWPWMVVLESGLSGFGCGGSLIGDRWVITSAVCVEQPDISVLVGSTNRRLGVRYNAHRIHIRPGADTQTNNIALIELDSPVEISDDVNIVCLPGDDEFLFSPTARECYATGWGKQTPARNNDLVDERLQQVKQPILSTEDCNNQYDVLKRNNENYRDTYDDLQTRYDWDELVDTLPVFNEDLSICAGYLSGFSSVCFGDGGSPLVCRDDQDRWTLVGVSSWGAFCQSFSVFARVTSHMDWIKQTMDENS